MWDHQGGRKLSGEGGRSQSGRKGIGERPEQGVQQLLSSWVLPSPLVVLPSSWLSPPPHSLSSGLGRCTLDASGCSCKSSCPSAHPNRDISRTQILTGFPSSLVSQWFPLNEKQQNNNADSHLMSTSLLVLTPYGAGLVTPILWMG